MEWLAPSIISHPIHEEPTDEKTATWSTPPTPLAALLSFSSFSPRRLPIWPKPFHGVLDGVPEHLLSTVSIIALGLFTEFLSLRSPRAHSPIYIEILNSLAYDQNIKRLLESFSIAHCDLCHFWPYPGISDGQIFRVKVLIPRWYSVSPVDSHCLFSGWSWSNPYYSCPRGAENFRCFGLHHELSDSAYFGESEEHRPA